MPERTIDVDKAALSPTSVFHTPMDVVLEESLSREDKLRILREWEFDARELCVAEDENMAGGEEQPLDGVLAAIQALTGEVPEGGSAPTLQGGGPPPPPPGSRSG